MLLSSSLFGLLLLWLLLCYCVTVIVIVVVCCFVLDLEHFLLKNHFTLAWVGFQEGPKVNTSVEPTIPNSWLNFYNYKKDNNTLISTHTKTWAVPCCVNRMAQPLPQGSLMELAQRMSGHAGNSPRAKYILLARPLLLPPKARVSQRQDHPTGMKITKLLWTSWQVESSPI